MASGEPIPDNATVHDVAASLKSYFRELDVGLLAVMREPLLQTNAADETVKWLSVASACHLLPKVNRDTFAALLEFLAKIDQTATKMTVSNLALLFAPNLFHVSKDQAPDDEPTRQALVSMLETFIGRPYVLTQSSHPHF